MNNGSKMRRTRTNKRRRRRTSSPRSSRNDGRGQLDYSGIPSFLTGCLAPREPPGWVARGASPTGKEGFLDDILPKVPIWMLKP